MERISIRYLQAVIGWIAQYHRIQGSSELEEAGNFIAGELERWGYDVKTHYFSYSEPRGTFPPVVGWDVHWAKVQCGDYILTLDNAPTLVLAHSPPADVEGEVVHLSNLEQLKHVDVSGKIVVIPGERVRRTYWRLQEAGAIGVMFYRKGLDPRAVPYYGLFLTPEEASRAKIPAVSIPGEMLNKLKKVKRARVLVESRYRDGAKAPVVVGERGEARVAFVAHYCHPGGTVNDNVSGVASLLTLARALSLSGVEGVRFVLTPEYYGTMALLESVGWDGVPVINVDMVGEDQSKTGSTLMLVRPPVFRIGLGEAIAWRCLSDCLPEVEPFSGFEKVPAQRFALVSYEMGSDHDVFLGFGVNSVMLNQWPDYYYHSSLDTVDKVDVWELTRLTGCLSRILEVDRRKAVRSYVRVLLAKFDVDSLSCNYIADLAKDYGVKVECERAIKRGVGPRAKVRPPISTRYLEEKLGYDHWIVKMIDEDRRMGTIFESIVPMLFNGEVDLDLGVELIREEFPVDGELIRKYVEESKVFD